MHRSGSHLRKVLAQSYSRPENHEDSLANLAAAPRGLSTGRSGYPTRGWTSKIRSAAKPPVSGLVPFNKLGL